MTTDSLDHTISDQDCQQLAREAIEYLRRGELVPRPGEYGEWDSALEHHERWVKKAKKITPEFLEKMAYAIKNDPALKDLIKEEEDDGIQIIPTSNEMPPLPDGVQSPPHGSDGACPWHDEYVAFSKQRSPRSFHNFHEANGWALLSAIAMRRVSLELGSKRYTPLFIANIASSSVAAKSEAAKVFQAVLSKSGLKWVMGPDNTTPQAMISDMATITALKEDSNYVNWSEDEKQEFKHGLAFQGQRGWFYEEFGEQIEAMCKPNGVMSDFKGIIRRMDDCYDEYSRSTITHKKQVVEYPYLSLIACMTPLDIRVQAGANSPFWRDGFFARFAFIVPTETEINRARFPKGSIWDAIPDSLITPLKEWNKWLGAREISIEPECEGDKIKRYAVSYGAFPERKCILTNDVENAFYRYGDALDDMMHESKIKQFEGNYKRFPMTAMRIAMLSASEGNDGIIEMRHWWKGQDFAEMARQGLHSIYGQTNITIDLQQGKPTMADKILSYMKEQKNKGNIHIAIRDIARYAVQGVEGEKIKRELDVLLKDSAILKENIKNKQGREIDRYRLP